MPLTSRAARPIAVDLSFADYHLTAQGKADLGGSRANFDSYEISSGSTKISGSMAAAWDAVRPALQGTLTSDKLVLDDLKLADTTGSSGAAPGSRPAPQRLFSDAPLDFDALKSADMNLDVAIKSLPAGSVELHDIQGKLVVNNGHLLLAPVAMGLGAGSIKGQINLDASGSPARLGMTFSIADVDLGDLIKVWGLQAFLTGKVNATLESGQQRQQPA